MSNGLSPLLEVYANTHLFIVSYEYADLASIKFVFELHFLIRVFGIVDKGYLVFGYALIDQSPFNFLIN